MVPKMSSIRLSSWSGGMIGGFDAQRGLMKRDSTRSESCRYCSSLEINLWIILKEEMRGKGKANISKRVRLSIDVCRGQGRQNDWIYRV